MKRRARRLGHGEVLHLSCREVGPPGCLSGLGPADVAELVSAAPALVLHPCEECDALPAVDVVRGALETLGGGHRLDVSRSEAPPVSPPSRRDLFGLARRSAPTEQERSAIPDGRAHGEAADQVRLAAALRAVVEHEGRRPAPGERTDQPTRAHAISSSGCTACSTCVRVCPTSALDLSPGPGDTVALTLEPAACIGCGRCLALCPVGALTDAGPVGLAELAQTPSPQVLEEVAVRPCDRCRTPFAGEGTTCQVCTMRQGDPFGSWLPPGYVAPRVYAPPPPEE